MISRLECTRVHFVQVSVSVSRPEDPGLGLETWWPRSLVLFQGIECVTSSSGLEFVGYLECKQSFWLTKIRDNITETYVVSKTVTDFAEIVWTRGFSAAPVYLMVYCYLRAVGRKVLWSSACVCAHCFCPQDISRTGSWITTKFGGWDLGVNL